MENPNITPAKPKRIPTELELQAMLNIIVSGACALVRTDEGLYKFFVHITSITSVILGEVPQDRIERVLGRIGTFKPGDVDPDPALTAAMLRYFELEARHGRQEELKFTTQRNS